MVADRTSSAVFLFRVLSIPNTVDTADIAECCDLPTAIVITPLDTLTEPPETEPPPRLIVPLVNSPSVSSRHRNS